VFLSKQITSTVQDGFLSETDVENTNRESELYLFCGLPNYRHPTFYITLLLLLAPLVTYIRSEYR